MDQAREPFEDTCTIRPKRRVVWLSSDCISVLGSRCVKSVVQTIKLIGIQ